MEFHVTKSCAGAVLIEQHSAFDTCTEAAPTLESAKDFVQNIVSNTVDNSADYTWKEVSWGWVFSAE